MAINLVIADNDPFVREALKVILGSDDGFSITACVENGRDAVASCLSHAVDVALLGIKLPGVNGIEATRTITSRTHTKPLILTNVDEEDYIAEIMQCGGRGCLLRSNAPQDIKDAIRVVYHGFTVLQNTVMDRLKAELPPSRMSQMDSHAFSNRELGILDLIAKGLSNREIAQALYISEGTVANYITSIFNKTGFDHRTQLAIYYLIKGKL